jgi:hypothetical protein
MTDAQLEKFKAEFLDYYSDLLLSAEVDKNQNLLIYIRPDIDIDETLAHISGSILDMVDFEEHLDVYVYRYGSNESVPLGIN